MSIEQQFAALEAKIELLQKENDNFKRALSASEYASKNLHDRFGRKASESNSPDRLALDHMSRTILIIEPNAIIKLPHQCQDQTHWTGRKTRFITIDNKKLALAEWSLGKEALMATRALGQFENEN